MTRSRPRLLLLADRPAWAFDFVARSLRRRLSGELQIEVDYSIRRPSLDRRRYDLLHVFYWADPWFRRVAPSREGVILEVASHRFRDEPYKLDEKTFAENYLATSCDLATTPSCELRDALRPHFPRIFLTPNGYEPSIFHPGTTRPTGDLAIAWVGRPEDPLKGLQEILLPACAGRFKLRWTDGSWTRFQIAELYRRSDVIAIASTSESQPLPLLEGMACGCFPVSTPVGLAPSLLRHTENGLLVERDVQAFQDAFSWCERHLERLRENRRQNAELLLRNRTWDRCASHYGAVYRYALERRGALPVAPPPEPRLLFEGDTEEAIPEPRHDRVPGLFWRLSDQRARLRRLGFLVSRRGLIPILRERLLSPTWYLRRLGRPRKSSSP